MKNLKLIRQNKKQGIILQCEAQIAESKKDIAESYESWGNRMGALPLETITVAEVENMLLEQKALAEEKLIAPVKTDIQLEMEKIGGANDRKEIEQKEKSLQAEIDKRTKDLAYQSGEQNIQAEKHKAAIKMYRPKGLAVFALSAFEVFLCGSSFQLMGLSTFLAYLAAGIFGIALHFYVSEIPLKIKTWCKGNIRKEVACFLITLLPLVFIFYHLAILRKSHAEELYKLDDIQVHINAGLFLALNLIATIVALFIVRIYRPDREIYKAYKEYEQQKKELEKERKEIQKLQLAKDILPNELDQRLYTRLCYLNRAKEVCGSSIAFYEAEFQKSKNSIIAKSNGGYIQLMSKVALPEIKNPYELRERTESNTHFLMPFLLGFLLLGSCGTDILPKQTPPKKAVALNDISENLLSQGDFFMIDKKGFKQAFMPENMTGGFEYEQKCISDLMYGEETQNIILKPKGNMFETSDRDFRAYQNIVAKQGAKMLNGLKDKVRGRNKTLLFFELHKTINELNQSKFGSSRIIACTDWSENSSLNFHNPKLIQALQDKPDIIYTEIEKEYPLIKLQEGKKIELIVLFKSENAEQDKRFFIISQHLKPYYESKGVEVHIVKHLNEITWSY